MRPAPDNILVLISEAERRKLFEKPIKTNSGEIIWLVTDLAAAKTEERYYIQTVTTGTVEAVGRNVKNVEVGDLVLLEYTVDADPRCVVYADELGKIVSISAISTYHDHSLIHEADRQYPTRAVTYMKGDIQSPSTLIAVLRDGVLLPNKPYILMEHVTRSTDFEDRGEGILRMEQEQDVVERTVIAGYEGSEFAAGDRVLIDDMSLFERNIEGRAVDIAYDHDILLRFH